MISILAAAGIGDSVVQTRWWLTGRPGWQIGATAPLLLWDSGVDTSFLFLEITAVVLAVSTAMGYGALRRARMAPGMSA